MVKIYFEIAENLLNQADCEQMAGLLQGANFEITQNEEESDVVIINANFKYFTEKSLLTRLKEFKESYKIVIITGCITKSVSKKFKKYPLVNTDQIDKIVEVVEEALNDNVIKEINFNEKQELGINHIRRNQFVEIIPISNGCLKDCPSCIIKPKKENYYSYPIEKIINRAQKAIDEDVKEIWLVSQDTGRYGFDINTDLTTLIEGMVRLNGKFKLGIGVMNLDSLLKIKEGLIECYKNKKVFKYLHLPILAGNNKILKCMGKKYTIEDYKNIVRLFKRSIVEINLETDIIIGYPGETEDEYWDTLNLIRETIPDSINISKYFSIISNNSEKVKKIPTKEIERRYKVLTDIFHNIAKMQNERWMGWEGPIIISQNGDELNQWIGRNESYKQVIVHGDYRPGQVIKIKVNKIDNFFIFATEIGMENKNRVVLEIFR